MMYIYTLVKMVEIKGGRGQLGLVILSCENMILTVQCQQQFTGSVHTLIGILGL